MHKIRRILRSTKGAFDLPSIMVGVVVLGIISGVTIASVFTAIPWAQDNAAKAALRTVAVAQANNFSSASKYATVGSLVTKKKLQSAAGVLISTNASKDCYIAVIKSDSGKIFWSSDKTGEPVEYQPGATSPCADLAAAAEIVSQDDYENKALPASLSGTLNGASITITINNTDGGAPIETNKLFRKVSGAAGNATQIATVTLNGTYEDITAEDGVNYDYYSISVAKNATESPASSILTIGLPVGNPFNVVTVTNMNSVSEYWTAVEMSPDGTKMIAGGSANYGGSLPKNATQQGTSSIWTSADSGATWTQRTTSGTRWYTAVAISDDGSRLAAVSDTSEDKDGGYIITSTDGGATWTERTNLGVHKWTGVEMNATGTRIVASAYPSPGGTTGGIWISSDSGATWTQKLQGSNIYALAASEDTTKLVAYISGGNNSIQVSIDSGVTWTSRYSDTLLGPGFVSISGDGSTIYYTHKTVLIKSVNNGVSWTTLTGVPAPTTFWNEVSTSRDGKTITVNQNNSTLTFNSIDGGVTWAQKANTPWNSTAPNGNVISTSPDGKKILMGAATGVNKLRMFSYSAH